MHCVAILKISEFVKSSKVFREGWYTKSTDNPFFYQNLSTRVMKANFEIVG